MVQNDQIFSPGNPLYNSLRQRNLDGWRKILRRVPNAGKPGIVCSLLKDINNRGDYDALRDSFVHYMGFPVLFYLYRMSEFSKSKH
jgi:hypothetical protein